MQRWCSKLRSLGFVRLSSPFPKPQQLLSSPHHHLRRGLFHSSGPNIGNKSLITHSMTSSNFSSLLFNAPSALQVTASSNRSPALPLSQRKRKLKSRQPLSPVVSKLKKIKMKSYSSFKGRFRVMKDGQIRRWKEGKSHNAHLKSKIAKRRGRLPGLVPAAYAKVMKKLNFTYCG
ncbi:hypothetical protein LXL04_032919 [Taraxacum kok-saghyz]